MDRTVRSVGRWLSLLACFWFAGARLGAAQPEDQNVIHARELFKRGVDAYDRGVYFEALQAFQAAYQLRPHPAVRVNIANCYDKLDRPADAIQNFEQFLGSGAGTPKQQEEVVRALDRLRKRVGRLQLHVTPEGAKVVIDDNEPRRAPIAEVVLLKAGRHQLSAALDGHETAMRVVDITADNTTELTIDLPRIDAAPVAAAPLAPAPAPQSVAATRAPPPPVASVPAPTQLAASKPQPTEESIEVPASVWIVGGITFAAVLTSIVTGQLALAADRDFNSDLAAVRNMTFSTDQRSAAWNDGINSANRAHTLAVTTDVLLSCSVVGAVLTTVLYLNAGPASPEVTLRTSGSQLQLQARF
jgi:hypothetical protein